MFESIIALLILILDIWAIINVIQSNAEVLMKVLWVIIILALPVVGLLLWYFAGPGKKTL